MPVPTPDLNNVIRRFQTTVAVYTHTPDQQVGDSVYQRDDFESPTDVVVSIRPDSETPRQHRVTEEGSTEAGGQRLYCYVPADHADAVGIGDSLDYQGRAWRVTEREHAGVAKFNRYLLVPDSRRSHGSRS